MERYSALLLSNIPAAWSEEHLRTWLEVGGFDVAALRLIRDIVSETSPSFAYVYFSDSLDLDEAARTLTGQWLDGHTLRVRPITPPEFVRSGTAKKLRNLKA